MEQFDPELERYKQQMLFANALRNKGMEGIEDIKPINVGQNMTYIPKNYTNKYAPAIKAGLGSFLGAQEQGRMEGVQTGRQQEEQDFLTKLGDAANAGGTYEEQEARINEASRNAPAYSPLAKAVQTRNLNNVLDAPGKRRDREDAQAAAMEMRREAAIARAVQAQRDAATKKESEAERRAWVLANRPAREPKTQIIQTVDEKGNPVQKVVELRAGDVYAGIPKAAGKTGNLPVAAQAMQSSLQNLESGLAAYQALLKDYDPQSKDVLTDKKRAALGGAFTDLQMRMKEAYGLGAITGPDMQVLQSALTDPTSMWGMTRGSFGGREPFTAQIDQASAALNRNKRNFEQQYGVELPAAAGQAQAPMPGAATGAPKGVTPEEWAAMSPEDRKLFQ